MGTKRCRFVQPNVVRLLLVDVHRRAQQQLLTKGKTIAGPDGQPVTVRATPEDLVAAEAAIAQAEADGEWVDVKAELNAGETRRIYTDLVKDFHAGERATLDPRQVGLTKMLNYIVAWSFTDAMGHAVPFSATALENLDTDTYAEVSEAIDAHDTAVEAQRLERKNGQRGESQLSRISPSVA